MRPVGLPVGQSPTGSFHILQHVYGPLLLPGQLTQAFPLRSAWVSTFAGFYPAAPLPPGVLAQMLNPMSRESDPQVNVFQLTWSHVLAPGSNTFKKN